MQCFHKSQQHQNNNYNNNKYKNLTKKKTNEKKKLNLVIPLKFQQCVGKFAEILFINWKRKKMKKKIGMKTECEKHGKKTRNSLRFKRMCISFFIYYTFFFSFRSV